MNTIDLIISIVILFFLTRGIFRGFVLELVAVLGLVIGYLAAITFQPDLVLFFKGFAENIPESILNIVAFAIIFIIVNVVLKISGVMITKTLKFALLGGLNRLLGGALGGLKGFVIIIITVFILQLLPFTDPVLEKAGKSESVLYPVFEKLTPEVIEQYQKLKESGELPV